MRNNDIMNLDIKIGYNDILKNEKILDQQSIGGLKGIHYKLHKTYNLSGIKKDVKILIYKAHSILLKEFEKKDIGHIQSDTLDIKLKRKIIEKKQTPIKKRQVFLLKKSIKKIG
jgi:hypothetical protein